LDISIEEDRPKAIFAHQEFKGVKMGAIESDCGDEWTAEQPFVISGHVHEYQLLGKNIMYVGTPYQTTFAESNNKGVFLFSFAGSDGDSAKRIKLKLRVKQKVVLQASELLTPDSTWKVPEQNEEGGGIDLRVEIVGKKEEIEGVKQLPIYNQMVEQEWIKIVFRPIFDSSKYDSEISRVSYLEALHNTIKNDVVILSLYKEILRDIQ
jgi:hypothetical protein